MAKAYEPYYNKNIGAALMGLNRRRSMPVRLGLGDVTTDISSLISSFQTPSSSSGGSSAPSTTPAALQTASTLVNDANTAANKVGAKPTNKTLNDVSAIAGKAAAIAAAFVPEGEVVAGVLLVVGAAAKVLSSIIGDTSINPTNLVNDNNDQLRDQIKTIDDQTAKVTQGLQQVATMLKQNGFSGPNVGRGLGLGNNVFLDQAQAGVLATAETPVLQAQLVQKAKNLQALIETFNITINDAYAAITKKSTGEKIILWGLLGLAILGFGYGLITTVKE